MNPSASSRVPTRFSVVFENTPANLVILTGSVHLLDIFFAKLENISKGLAALYVFAPHPRLASESIFLIFSELI